MNDTTALTETQVPEQSSIIRRLMGLGFNDRRVLFAMGTGAPEIFESEEVRQLAAARRTNVPFDGGARDRLVNLIKTVRREYEKQEKVAKAREAAIVSEGTEGVCLADVDEVPIARYSSMMPAIDKVLGCTPVYDSEFNVIDEKWGFGIGQLGMLGREAGVGKTTLYTALAVKMAEDQDAKIGVFQGEMLAGEFKGLLMSICRANKWLPKKALSNIYCYRQRNHQVHCREIVEKNLNLFIWDSFNLLKGQNTSDGIDEIVFDVKKAMEGRCSGLMIAHLNEKGTLKGNNRIGFMADAKYFLMKAEEHGEGVMRLYSEKNRAGKLATAWLKKDGKRILELDSDRYDAIASEMSGMKKK